MTGGTARTFTYDGNGNTMTDGIRTYQWDAQDRLVAVEIPAQSRSEFTYDGLSRRLAITEKLWDANTSTFIPHTSSLFVWDGTEIAEQRAPDGTTVEKRFYQQGEQRLGGTDVGSYFYTRDHLGSIRELTDDTGAIRARYDYDPYGSREKLSGDLDCDFAFTGHFYHAPTGLHLALYRAYDAETGRWLSVDPIREAGGIHLYAYVANNPINLIDPDGLDAVPAPGGGYNFIVRPGLNLNNLTGSSITHPNDRYSGQCATGAQFLTGTNVNGRIHDAPSTQTWRPGEPVGPGMRPGTMVATGWDKGRYPSAPPSDYRRGGPREGQTVNHTGIFLGMNRDGSINLFDQAAGLTLKVRRHDAEGYRAVVSDQKYDPSPSSCGVTARPAR